MKKIVILIDGTWDKEGTTGNTNVAKLGVNALIKRRAANGTVQQVRYHDGVGAYGDIFKKTLGGAIGLGLKKIVRDCYGFLVDDYEAGDEIYISWLLTRRVRSTRFGGANWRIGHCTPPECRYVRDSVATLSR